MEQAGSRVRDGCVRTGWWGAEIWAQLDRGLGLITNVYWVTYQMHDSYRLLTHERIFKNLDLNEGRH